MRCVVLQKIFSNRVYATEAAEILFRLLQHRY